MTRTLILLLLIAALATGCKPAAPSPDFDIQGRITDILPGGQYKDFLGTIRIEGEPVAGASYDKAVVAVTKSTRIWEKRGDSYVKASWADLQFGALVQAKFTGPVRESYPVQADAAEIVILGE